MRFYVKKMLEANERCTLSIECGVSTMAVSWTLEDIQPSSSTDWVGLFEKSASNNNYIDYIKTNGTKVGMNFVNMPVTPGLYHFRFFPSGSYHEIAISDEVYIGPEIDLIATKEEGYISVTWNLLKGEVSPSDWFGLYRVGANSRNYLQYFGLNPEKNFMIVDKKLIQGKYEMRYFPSGCGYTHVKSSNIFIVEGKDSLAMDFEYGSHNRIKNIILRPDLQSIKYSTTDWIGLYRTESESYDSYRYVNKQKTLIFPAPRSPGNYQFRYHSSYKIRNEEIMRSEIFTIDNTDILEAVVEGNLVKVSWNISSQKQTTYDWIGLYNLTETSNRNYLQCNYINLSESSTIYPLPTSPGLYQFRYFSSAVGKYKSFLNSNTITIQ
eukprot:TRINITY_DN4211_c0_g1_i2.p1 TRINITY_DN4211_c0_g1~~TRINITY_DN4211_c0_g1_i2.p1  ORF type:complete len:380 (+),score=48.64 TRINITY_DN4211_c0_g1_i2:551-1690(+)